jgi:hypothetical protein
METIMPKKTQIKEEKISSDERRPYEAPDFFSSLAFERKSLACSPATRNASPDFPTFCSMQS